jgi:hypothetical protein
VRYTASAQTTSLVRHPPDPKKSYRRLGPDLERIIDAAIQTHYLVRSRKPMEEVYKEVRRRCHAENRVTPARNSVIKRIRSLDARLVARKRLGAKSLIDADAMLAPAVALERLKLVAGRHR